MQSYLLAKYFPSKLLIFHITLPAFSKVKIWIVWLESNVNLRLFANSLSEKMFYPFNPFHWNTSYEEKLKTNCLRELVASLKINESQFTHLVELSNLGERKVTVSGAWQVKITNKAIKMPLLIIFLLLFIILTNLRI